MIIKLNGGLGNTLFQWAYGRSYELATGEEVFFDKSSLASGHPPRRYGLGDYNIEVKFAPDDMPGERLCDYWQSEKYFNAEVIRKELVQPKGTPNPKCICMAKKILHSPDCGFIGIRRADYLWPERIAYHGVLPIEYYQRANLEFPVKLNREWFIFTDDKEWAKQIPYEVVDVNGPEEKHWDIWLMSLCKHAIISNSTFHWWGAWLGADKRGGKVICPKNWFANGMKTEIVPQRWITL